MAEQAALEPQVGRIREYGHLHPDTFSYAGYGVSDGTTVSVAAFTRDLERHRAAIAQLLDHPHLLEMRQEPLSAVEVAQLRDELEAELCSRSDDEGWLGLGVGTGFGRVHVSLRPEQSDVAAELHQRYGDRIRVEIGVYRAM